MGSKPVTRLTVTDKERLTPGMVRLRFHGEDLSAFAGSVFTDRYVKLVFGDPAAIERGERPALRTYTALDPDPVAGTLAIDFVVHGDAGVAGPWAATAEPGDTINVRGPGGAYAPDATADWHLFAGDEAAVPAIRQSLAALPDDAEGTPSSRSTPQRTSSRWEHPPASRWSGCTAATRRTPAWRTRYGRCRGATAGSTRSSTARRRP